MFGTLAFYTTVFYRKFSGYTARALQAVELNFGLLFPLISVGKHPGCTPSELVHALRMDWGYGQRSIQKLVDGGFISRRKEGRAYHLDLCEKGKQAFDVSHQVFFDWDQQALSVLTLEEQTQMKMLLGKIKRGLEEKK